MQAEFDACAGAGGDLTVWETLANAWERGEWVALATIVGSRGSAPQHGGARMVVFGDGRIVGTIGGGKLEHRVIAEALAALTVRRPRRYDVNLTRDLGMCCGGAVEVYIEPMAPRDVLYLFGAGHVGAAVCRQAQALGFAVTVVDEREEWLTHERFPGAVRVDRDPRRVVDEVPEGAWVFVTTHEHALDQDLVEKLLPRPLRWLGLIGSKAKVARFRVRLLAAGLAPEVFDRLRSPAGLDIGAESPEEIAVSIAAEWVQVRHRNR